MTRVTNRLTPQHRALRGWASLRSTLTGVFATGKKSAAVVCLAVVANLWPQAAFACPVCFGATDAPMARGSSMGVLALLVVTAGMLGAFGWFFRTLARRERDAAALSMPETAAARRREV